MKRRLLGNAVPHSPSWGWVFLLSSSIAAVWLTGDAPLAVKVIVTMFLAPMVAFDLNAAVWWARHREYAAAAKRLMSVILTVPTGEHLHVGASCYKHYVMRFGPLRRRQDVITHTTGEDGQASNGEPWRIVALDLYTVIDGAGRVSRQTRHHKVYANGETEPVGDRPFRLSRWANRSGFFDMSPDELNELADRLEVGLRQVGRV